MAEHYPGFRDRWTAEGPPLPRYVEDEFEAYLNCGLLEHGFLRVKCDACQAEKLVAFSCKRHGFCPGCGTRRMAETAALLVDNVLPQQPVCQWVLSLPFALRYRLAKGPREGQKVFTLQTLPAEPDAPRGEVTESSGFSLHAGIAAKALQSDKVERLARYVSRPPVATERSSLTQGGNVRFH